jgi:hypothetical protein
VCSTAVLDVDGEGISENKIIGPFSEIFGFFPHDTRLLRTP